MSKKTVKRFVRFKIINGLRQNPADWDFHITPVLTYSQSIEPEGYAKGLAIEWGHWALAVGLFTILK